MSGGGMARIRRLAGDPHAQARLCAIADQGLQGVASLLAAGLLARALPPTEFGIVGITVGLYYFMAGFHRSAIVLPYITERGRADAGSPAYHADWWWLSLVAALALGLALVAMAGLGVGVAQVRPAWGWFVAPALYAAVITPPLLAADHVRRWLYQVQRPVAVVAVSAAYFVAMVGIAALAGHVAPSAETGILAWAGAGIAGAIVGLAVLRPGRPHPAASRDAWARNRRFAGLQSLTHLPYAVYSNATVVVPIGLLVGPEAAAVFTAARTLTNPALSLVTAVDSTDKPRAARALAADGLPGLRRAVGKTRSFLALLTGLYLAAIALFAGWVVSTAFHGRYDGIDGIVRLLAFAFFLICLNQPSETFLIVLRASGALLVTRTIAAVATLAGLIIAIPYGVAGMAVAIAAAQVVTMAALLAAERIAGRNARISGPAEAKAAAPDGVFTGEEPAG